MKALSFYQPWASAIALSLKTLETRSWHTHYRGPLAIHAGRHQEEALRNLFSYFMHIQEFSFFYACRNAGFHSYGLLPFGAVVAVAELWEVLPVEHETVNALAPIGSLERELGNFSAGRWVWRLRDLKPLAQPYFVRGRQGLFDIDLPRENYEPTMDRRPRA